MQSNVQNSFATYIYKHRYKVLLFIISVAFIFFFTLGVPPFWEEQLYQAEYVQQPTLHWIKEIFLSFGKNNIFNAERPFDALLFKGLFALTGYNYVAMRFIKSLFFGFFIVLIFTFIEKYRKNTAAALGVSAYIMCTLSLYIHVLVFAEPYLLTEIIKLVIFFIFLKDYFAQKTSWSHQFLVGLLFLLSVRMYVPAYSVMGILGLFVLLHNWRKIKRYLYLFLFFIFSAVPWPLTTRVGSSAAFAPKLSVMEHFFTYDLLHYSTSPLFSLSDLYYKPFFAIITFFGFWCIMLLLTLFLLYHFLCKLLTKHFYSRKEREENERSISVEEATLNVTSENKFETKSLTLFLFVWLFAELPLWIILPEFATRYATSVLLPFSLLVVVMTLYVLSTIRKMYRKYVAGVIILLVVLAILTNVAYITAFRGGWGSSFIAIEDAQDFIASDKEGNTIGLYYGFSTADEYYPINKSSPTHELIPDLYFEQQHNEEDFTKEKMTEKATVYDTIYVLKRLTTGGTELPEYTFEEYEYLTLVKVVEGTRTSDPYDFLMKILVRAGVNYNPNYIYIYKYNEEEIPSYPEENL